MKRDSKTTDVYKPNKQVTVSVVNKPREDDGRTLFERTVTIKIKAGSFAEERLVFEEEDSIAKFIEKVDFEDPQTSLV